MNRRERRTKGKAMVKRLQELRNSKVLQALNFNDIPKETMDALIAGTCDNLCLQKRYDLSKKLLNEAISIEVQLDQMRGDLASKTSKQG